jgi:hypothetical protein
MTCDTKEKEFARRTGWELKSDWQLNKGHWWTVQQIINKTNLLLHVELYKKKGVLSS